MKKQFLRAALAAFATISLSFNVFAQQNGTFKPLNFENIEPTENIDPKYTAGNQYAFIQDSTGTGKPRKAIVRIITSTEEIVPEVGDSYTEVMADQYVITEGSDNSILQQFKYRIRPDVDGNKDELLSCIQNNTEYKIKRVSVQEDETAQKFYTQCFEGRPIPN